MGDTVLSADEVREVSGLSASHVVLVGRGGKFTPELKETDSQKDLPLGVFADGVPQGRGVGVVREWRSVHLHGPGELDSVGVDNVSNESKHGNTSMPSSMSMSSVNRCQQRVGQIPSSN